MGEGARVASSAILHSPESIRLGPRAFVGDQVLIWGAGGVSIGEDSIIAAQTVITSQSHDVTASRRGELFSQTRDDAFIAIGANVWIGAHATILPGVKIGDGAVVAAGAVVRSSVLAGTVVAGVPARIVRA